MTHTSTPHYRDGTAAGFKGNSAEARETGKEAAKNVTETLNRRHRQMMEAWAPYGSYGATPEEVAGDLGLPVHVVRPRAGELVKRGMMFEVGKRPGLLGCRVMAYSIVKPSAASEAP
ncbi:hypothetical protein [Altererythrobacter sp. C41]|uniref:hypothetical protein n=1 Tax=Altererythrobacter sp. C41 TaxID=2806021 RepID=UPI0019334E76|nr:hypothetical protein [Altererythrobacter sp. C41]MBM0169685.1 hypothetical protein [Altererythrobacter sp. C41]